MAIVTTYICDVTGKQSNNKDDFVTVRVEVDPSSYSYDKVRIDKTVCKEFAKKLNLVPTPKTLPQPPEVTFEGKLRALLEDFVGEMVEENVAQAVSR